MVPDECDYPALRIGQPGSANPLLVNGFFWLTVLFASACSTLPPMHGELDFSVAGRVGAVAGTTGTSAEFLWRQYESGFDVEFWGPLGQGRTHLIANGDTLAVRTSRGERVIDADARDWIRRELRLEIPIRALSSWITGRPSPAWPVSGLDADTFTQLGWNVEVGAWDDWDGRRQPRKLTATRGDYRVTIVCRQWTFGAR